MHFLNRRLFLQTWLAAAGTSYGRSSQARTADVEISTPLGRLQGREQGGVRTFSGVPFAQAPVNQLRFRPPAEITTPWTGVRPSFDSPAPIQANRHDISEDCLYLNVFAPSKPGSYPVFVWIYGGGNIGGSANLPLFDGSTFARNDVVCVVINYRVGLWGFLELGGVLGPAYRGSGDNAIRDQVQALRWVRKNITAFGGDPTRVTVGGESAGAKNVAALLASPEADKLFNQAIVESGSAQTVHSLAQAEQVAELLLKSSGLRATQLLALPVSDLLKAQKLLLSEYPANYPFRAVTGTGFLPDIPLKQIANGSSSGVNLLVGTNRDESSLFVDPAQAARSLVEKQLGNASLSRVNKMEAPYKASFPDSKIQDLHIRILTAEEYWIPTVRIAEARAQQPAKTFLYRFDHTPATGPLAGKAAHASELAFVWDHAASEPALANSLHAAWVSFIKTGVPTAAGLPPWPPFRLPQRLTMLLNSRSNVESDPNRKERELWVGQL